MVRGWRDHTEEMGPFHFPALDFFVFGLGEPQALRGVLELEGDSVELDFGDDSSIGRSGSGVIQDVRAVIQIVVLDIDRTAIAQGGASNC